MKIDGGDGSSSSSAIQRAALTNCLCAPLIVGFDRDHRGDMLINGRQVVGAALSRSIVFQDHRLLPPLIA
jgi:ABC-type taurine transport system ATPase subunit